jgi:glucose-1-phosphate thymidylyltransferase
VTLVGVIPAAGYGTRLGARMGSKEMIPVAGRPVMDHLVERMRAVAVDEIRVVTRPDKDDVIAHAAELGAEVVLGHPADVAASVRLGMAGLEAADEMLFGFPDCLWEPVDGFVPVVAALRAGADVALGLFRLQADLERSDVVVTGAGDRVERIEVKPANPPGDRIWGVAAARAAVLDELQAGVEPSVTFDRLARAGLHVAGVALSDRWLDIGTPESLRRAQRGNWPLPGT